MNLNQGKRNKQAVQVLNKVEYDSDGNPIGMMEDPSNPASANFGTPREPRRGGCYRGDGVRYVVVNKLKTPIESTSIFKLSLYVNLSKLETRSWKGLAGKITNSAYVGEFGFYIASVGVLRFRYVTDYGRHDINIPLTTLSYDNDFVKLVGVIDNSLREIRVTVNSAIIASQSFIGGTLTPSNIPEFNILTFGSNSTTASVTDIYNVCIEADNFLLAKYNCSENSGNICYDSSGNGNHGQIINAITTTPEENPNSIHQYQDVYSFENEEGYSESGNVIIPKNSSITIPSFKDVLGNNLQYIGKVPGKAKFVNSSCLLSDGNAYLTGNVLTTDTITARPESEVPVCTIDGRLDFPTVGGKYFDVTIKRSGSVIARLPLCEPIIDPSNHIYHDVSGNGNHATLVNGTLANEGKQDKFHYLQRGFSNNFNTVAGSGSRIYTMGSYGKIFGRKLFLEFYLDISRINPSYQNDIVNFRDLSASYECIIATWAYNALRIAFAFSGSGRILWISGLTGMLPGLYRFDIDLDRDPILIIYKNGIVDRTPPIHENTVGPSDVITLSYVSIFARSTQMSTATRYVRGIIGPYVNINDEILINTYLVQDELNPEIEVREQKNEFLVKEIFPYVSDDFKLRQSVHQDSHSFLNTGESGTELEAYDYPALKQADKNDNFWNEDDGLGTVAPKPVQFDSLITQKGLSDKLFLDSSVSETIKNVRMYGNDLKGRQLNTENKLTNNV